MVVMYGDPEDANTIAIIKKITVLHTCSYREEVEATKMAAA